MMRNLSAAAATLLASAFLASCDAGSTPAPDAKGETWQPAPAKDTDPATPDPTNPVTPNPDEPRPDSPNSGMNDEQARVHREFQTAVEKRIYAVGTQLDALKTRAEEAVGDAKIRLEQLYAELDAKRDDIAAQLDDLRVAAADTWNALKDDLEKSLTELESRLTDALS